MVKNNKKTHALIFNVDEGLYEVKHKCTELSMSRSQQYFVLLSNWLVTRMHACMNEPDVSIYEDFL